MAEKKSITKKRYWSLVMYPDSMPDDWLDRLGMTGLEIVISPLHDKDLNATGEPKKPHYHVLLCWKNPTTYANAKTIADSLNAPIPKPIDSVRGMYEYLTHKNNPEKAQYDDRDIRTLNGFNLGNFTELTKNEKITNKKAMATTLEKIIFSLELPEYAEFINKVIKLNEIGEIDDETAMYAREHTMHFNALLKSRRYGYDDWRNRR